jgi:hypothetical protein
MAYKFQLGSAQMSGSLVQEGDLYVSSSDSNEAARNLDVQGSIKLAGTQVFNTDRDLVNLVDVDGTGDLSMGTITMTGFSVDADGDTALKSLAIDNSSTIGCDADTDIITLADMSMTLANNVDFNVAKAGGLQIAGAAVTSTAAELNLVDGITAGTVAASKAVIVDSDKDISGFRNVTATGYFEIGSAQLVEADMELIDGLTAGTVAASKAVTVDSNKDASGFRNVTATGAFIIGSANLNEADMEQIDGITAGTVAASKAVVVDSNKDADGFRNLSGSGLLEIDRITVNGAYGIDAVGNFTGTKLTLGSAVIVESELEMLDGITAGTVAASKAVVVDANKDASGFRNISASVHVSASAFYGDGSQLTGLESEYVKTTTNSVSATRYIPFVDEATGDDDESLMIHSAVAINPSTGVFTIAGSAPEFVIGSAVLSEAELEVLDGVTAGTVAASKVVVADANKDASGFRNIDGTGDLTMGTITMTGFGVDADGDTQVKSVSATDFTAGGGLLPLIDSNKKLVDNAQITYDVGRNLNGYNSIAVSSSASGSGYLGDGLLFIADASGSDVFLASGQGVGMGYDSTLQSGEGDNIFYFSPADGEIKWQYDGTSMYFGKDSDVELMHIADTGLRLNSGMALQFRDSAVHIASDHDGMLDIEADNSIDFNIGATETLSVQSAKLVPGSDGAVDLGSSGLEFKDLYIDGVAYIDSLQADQLGAALDANNQAITNINVDGGAIDGTTVGATTPAAGVFTTLQANGQVTIGDASGDGVNWNAGSLDMTSNALTWQIKDGVDGFSGNGALLMFTGSGGDFLKVNTSGSQKGVVFPRTFYPSSDDAIDIGASDKQFKDIYIDGTAYLDAISGGSIDLDGTVVFSNASLQFSGLADTAFNLANDELLFRDADDSSKVKRRSWATIMGQIAGSGITNTNGVLSVQGNEVALKADGGTLAEGYNYFANASSNVSVNLPASPTVGDVVHVKAGALTSGAELTIGTQGSHVIDGEDSVAIESSYGAVSLVYVVSNNWRIV